MKTILTLLSEMDDVMEWRVNKGNTEVKVSIVI